MTRLRYLEIGGTGMKKYTTLMLTFLLLFTTMFLVSLQGMPEKGRAATAGSGRGTEGRSRESYRDRRIRSEDRGRGIDRYTERNRDRDSLRNEPTKDPSEGFSQVCFKTIYCWVHKERLQVGMNAY